MTQLIVIKVYDRSFKLKMWFISWGKDYAQTDWHKNNSPLHCLLWILVDFACADWCLVYKKIRRILYLYSFVKKIEPLKGCYVKFECVWKGQARSGGLYFYSENFSELFNMVCAKTGFMSGTNFNMFKLVWSIICIKLVILAVLLCIIFAATDVQKSTFIQVG